MISLEKDKALARLIGVEHKANRPDNFLWCAVKGEEVLYMGEIIKMLGWREKGLDEREPH